MTPEQLAQANSEHAHQTALFAAIALAVAGKPSPEMREIGVVSLPTAARLAFALHNQGSTGNAREGARAQAEGVRAGVPDICLPVAVGRTSEAMDPEDFQWHGCYIELKRPVFINRKDGGCSVEQVRWIKQLRQQGYYVDVAWGWKDALNKIACYLASLPFTQFDGFDRDTLSLVGY